MLIGSVNELSPDQIRNLFDLNTETGELRWSTSVSRGYLTHRLAGSPTNNGYVQIKVGKKVYLAHRIVWAIVYGEWPKSALDHVDGNRANNAVCNLRLVSHAENMQNLSKTRQCTASGLIGAAYVPGGKRRRDRWAARIKVNGVSKYIGTFKTPEEAQKAYLDAKRELHPFAERAFY